MSSERMRSTTSPILNVLTPAHELVDGVLAQAADPAQRPAALSEMLRTLWPSSPLYACSLQITGEVYVSVRDEAGHPRPAWAELLRDKLAKGDPGKRPALCTVKLPRAVKLPGHTLVVEDITFAEHRWGTLALARPDTASAEVDACLRLVLTTCAEQLALRLYLEAHQHALQALRELLAEQAALADVGELAGSVMHAVNNFLNVVSLHVAVLEQEVPPELRAELAEIRRQGKETAAVVKEFQHYRTRQRPTPGRIDLNRAIHDAVEELCRPDAGRAAVLHLISSGQPENPGLRTLHSVPVHLELAPELPPVLGTLADLKRLCTFLLRSAAAAAAPRDGAIWVRTEKDVNRVLLRVEDTGPRSALASPVQLGEPGKLGREGTDSLELAACRALVKRHQGTIRAENRAEGGAAVIVDLLAK